MIADPSGRFIELLRLGTGSPELAARLRSIVNAKKEFGADGVSR
jgi:hypothetical protein